MAVEFFGTLNGTEQLSGDINATGQLIGSAETAVNYAFVTNQPSINGVTLVGNKTSSELGIDGGGFNTVSTGLYSHAEGANTRAKGSFSHAEGYDNIAISTDAHVEGHTNIAGQARTYTITAFDNTAKTLTLDKVTDLVVGDKIVIYGTTEIYEDLSITAINGLIITLNTTFSISSAWLYAFKGYPTESDYGAHGEGSHTVSTGFASHAEGSGAIAIGNQSHAEGYQTKATWNSAHAEGSQTQAMNLAAHSEGRYTIAYGAYSHAEGYSTTAYGTSSHSEGDCNVSQSNYSHTEGQCALAAHGTLYTITAFNNTAKTITLDNVNGLAVGDKVQIKITNLKPMSDVVISAISSLTVTLTTTATLTADWLYVVKLATTQYATHAEGNNTLASGSYSHSEGYKTVAKGNYGSHAEGANTIAGEYGAHAEGQGTIASGMYSHAEGYQSTSEGSYTHSEGYKTRAWGDNSHSQGNSSVAAGINSHAGGHGAKADGWAQTAIGCFNVENGFPLSKNNTDHAFIIGNGTSDTDRSNALSVDWLGNVNIASGATYKINGIPLIQTTTVTLTVVGWSNKTQTVSVSGVTDTNNIMVSPSPASQTDYMNAGIRCTQQTSNALTFVCTTTPTASVSVNILILGV